MSKLTYVLAIAASLLVVMQVYLHAHSVSSDLPSAADMETASHAHQVQLVTGLNKTLLALHSELDDIAQLHRQVKHARQQAADEGRGKLVVPLVRKKPEAATNSINVKHGSRDTAHAGDSNNNKGGTKKGDPVSSLSSRVDKEKRSESGGSDSGSGISAKRALVFTMDSISAYEADSKRGGAAGEIRVRESVQAALKQLGVEVKVAKSDAEFEQCNGANFDFIVVDPWTWAARGWVPKAPLRGHDSKVFVLDFFGSPKLKGTGFNVPAKRFLTAFGSPWNTFLGYSMTSASALTAPKKKQGVLWGKDPRHFAGKEGMLHRVADSLAAASADNSVTLVSTATKPVFQHANIKWLGHQTGEQWDTLLRDSRFLVGLGDPLLGPSALDAIAAGCMYINPILKVPVKGSSSQHPWAAENIGAPYVCSYQENDAKSLGACIAKAMTSNLTPLVPVEFTHDAYVRRVKGIFGL
jgi:hypothetical protein